ncbi:hypothetical protein DFJ58DRAFT_728221 [Suillus subalutaceus]|uniref:uncharacterized protein n=1 Tax=Suillus subalutaceus TaxID=48586 RepID=UPI001B87914B|nr:uncharacterized protein DFJ58DRAFT_728221 [Suillus subalutaceus]KAG1853465.1 hypothetical protein DFJ58DRAFT_728221 [Suillus subalutaceus]
MTQPQLQTKPNQPIDGAPQAKKNQRAPRKRKTVHRNSPVNTWPNSLVNTRAKTPINMYMIPAEETIARQKRERDEAIKRVSLRDAEMLKKWHEQVERTSKRARDDEEVDIVEPAAKMMRTGKERAVDEDEDDEVVIVEPPARNEKEMEERRLRNMQERQLRLKKAGLSMS